MDPNLLKLCEEQRLEEYENCHFLPCPNKIQLLPEDEVSVDSILSHLISTVVPSIEEIRGLKWEISAKDMLNEKQNLIFEEQFYISSLNQTCLMQEQHKLLLDRDLEHMGYYKLNVEESYDGFVVFSKSSIDKNQKDNVCGHNLTAKYDGNFKLVAEKRWEYCTIDHARIEKTLKAHLKGDTLVAKRQTKINSQVQKFKANINMKDRKDVLLLDGGVMLLGRFLIVNNFRGTFQYYTMNMNGRILRCVVQIHNERKKVRMYNRIFNNAILVVNTQYFKDVPQDISETYYESNGHLILHYWHGFKYIIHAVRAPKKATEVIIPKLELMWKSDPLLCRLYKETAVVTYEKACEYLSARPEIFDILHDFLLNLLQYKPDNVLEFLVSYCQNIRRNY